MERNRIVWGTALAAAAMLAPPEAQGQYDRPPAPAAYALENVTVVSLDGARQSGVTLVVRDGLVEVMAPGASVPVDAQRLEGDSLFVYPGFVDADAELDVTWPEARDVEDEDDVTAWDPPRSRQGFTPHRSVASHLTVLGTGLAEQRRDGVVAMLAHPDGGMAPGRPAVVVARTAARPWELVQRPDVGLTMSFRTAGGVYPSQLFGVIAYLRQAFLDAERWRTMRDTHQANPGGFAPPGWDPDFDVLQRAGDGEFPVYFRADSDEDIRRVLDLADEVGFRPVVMGGEEAWKLADELARRQVPVLVSLDFPEPDDWDPEADTVEAELSPSALREKERIENARGNPGRLAAAGVTVALTSGGGEADLLEGIRLAVEHGMDAGQALRALTRTPATLLGIPEIVRIAPGAPATFVVATGDLAEDDTRVAYTFVEGALEEGEAVGGDTGGEEPAGDLTGSWEGEIEAGGQESAFTLTLEQAPDGSLSGTITPDAMGPAPVSGRISGRSVTLRIEAEGLPEPIELAGTLSEDGNSMSGSGDSPFGSIDFTANRTGGGDWTKLLGGVR